MKPIIVAGGGIAGLAACWWLKKRRIPHFLLEAAADLGGRFNTVRTDDWVADPGTPYIQKRDRIITAMIREFGLENDLVSVQDSVMHMTDEGLKPREPRDTNAARVCLRDGMDSLFRVAERELEVYRGIRVEAVRWKAETDTFELMDGATDRSFRHPVSGKTMDGSGLVLAVNAPSAKRIARNSSLLKPVEELIGDVRFKPNLVGLFKVPRMDPGFYAIERNPSPDLQWIGFEERKIPSRVKPEWSLVVARAGDEMSRDLRAASDEDALLAIYAAAQKHIPDLPDRFTEAMFVRFTASRPMNPMVLPADGIPTDPPGVPIALAGDYVAGRRAEDAAQSGLVAAQRVMARMGARV